MDDAHNLPWAKAWAWESYPGDTCPDTLAARSRENAVRPSQRTKPTVSPRLRFPDRATISRPTPLRSGRSGCSSIHLHQCGRTAAFFRCFQAVGRAPTQKLRSEEHTSDIQSLMRISYAVFSLKKK